MSTLSPSYWRSALSELRNSRRVVAAAVLIALDIALNLATIYITISLRVSLTFLTSASTSLICGPILAPLSAIVCDVIGFFTSNSMGDPFFPGYTLSAMLSSLTYALFFYRKKITFPRIYAAKTVVSIFVNTLIGSVWRVMLYGTKTYWLYVLSTGIKNIVLLPLEAALLTLVLGALMTPMKKLGLIGECSTVELRRHSVIISVIISILLSAVLITLYVLGIIKI